MQEQSSSQSLEASDVSAYLKIGCKPPASLSYGHVPTEKDEGTWDLGDTCFRILSHIQSISPILLSMMDNYCLSRLSHTRQVLAESIKQRQPPTDFHSMVLESL